MVESRIQLSRDPAYDRFLSATVGEDERGTDVTVLSMLARLGFDPWVEASDLAEMPQRSAQERLEVLMTGFTDVPISVRDCGGIVSRLLAFLPKHSRVGSTSSAGPLGHSQKLAFAVQLYCIIATVLLLGWIAFRSTGH